MMQRTRKPITRPIRPMGPLSRKIMDVAKRRDKIKRVRKLYPMEWKETGQLQKWFNHLGKLAGKKKKGRGNKKTYVALSDVIKTLVYGFVKFPVSKQIQFIRNNVPAELNPEDINTSRLLTEVGNETQD